MEQATKIIYVDDESDARLIVKEILKSTFTVATASSVDEALTMLPNFNPDLVITDIRMPGKDGLQLLKDLKISYKNMPVILVTGHGDKKTAIDGIRGGAFDFIEKPFEDEELLFAVDRAIAVLSLNRRLAEIQLRSIEAEKLATLGLLAGGIAHEINTPLCTILINSHLILEQLPNDAPWLSAIKKSVQMIEETTDRVGNIVRSLLSFSRSSTSAPTTLLNTITMDTLLENIRYLCSAKFKEQNIELKMAPERYQHIAIQCRESEIAQVIFNLLINGSQAVAKMQQDRWVALECEDTSENVSIIVTDSGPGISPEIRQKIFLPFFTTKEVGQGTGLGLSISVGIIESHRGKIWLDENRKNTTFIVRLPKEQYHKS